MNDLDLEEEQGTRLLISTLEERCLNLILQVDVSGRHSGSEEVLLLLQSLLSMFDGVAIDDYTSHAWTLKEIMDEDCYQNHTFFDYNGWYQEKKRRDT